MNMYIFHSFNFWPSHVHPVFLLGLCTLRVCQTTTLLLDLLFVKDICTNMYQPLCFRVSAPIELTLNFWHPIFLVFTEELALRRECFLLVECSISDVPKLFRHLFPILEYPASTRSTEFAKEFTAVVI